MSTSHFIFKLRHNISLEGDVILAEMELKAFLPEQSIEGIQNLPTIFITTKPSFFPDSFVQL